MPEDPTALDFVNDPGEIYQGVWPQSAELRRTGELLRLVATITCPLVAIHGDYDPHPAAGIQEPLAANLEDFCMIILEKCGHTPGVKSMLWIHFTNYLSMSFRYLGRGTSPECNASPYNSVKGHKGKEQGAGMEPSFSEEDRRYAQLEAIFRTHVADLYRYIYRQVHHAVIAEDLTSAVFLKALRWLQQDRSPESVKGWLYATARSIIADYWREQTQIHQLPLEAVEEMPMLPEESDEQMRPLQARIQRLLDGLPSRERAILTLRYFQGYSAAEIGQVLGLSAKHVRVLQLRALRRAALLEAEERSVPVESLSMQYNEQALRVLELTKEEARAFNHNYMGTEHLLLGILREGSAAAELNTQGVTFEGMRGGIMFVLGGRPQGIAVSQLDFTPRTQKVLAMAGEEAQRLGETAISPHHLLVAILREGQGIAAQLLQVSGVRLEQVGETVHISMIPDTEERPITLPTDFQEALQQHPAAHTIFERLSNSKKKRFVDRIEQAEGESARSQQVEKAIELLQQIHQQHQRLST